MLRTTCIAWAFSVASLAPAEGQERCQYQPREGGILTAQVRGLTTSALNDDDAENRRVAVWASGHGRYSEANAVLVTVLECDPEASVREMAAWSIGRMASTAQGGEAKALSRSAVNDDNLIVQETAVWALTRLSPSGNSTVMLENAYASNNPNVRERVVWAIGRYGDSSSLRTLNAAIQDSIAAMRVRAAWALGRIGHVSSVDALSGLLKYPDPAVRRAGIWALASIGGPSALDALALASGDSDPELRRRALSALGGAGPEAWPMPWPDPKPRPHPDDFTVVSNSPN